MVKTHLLASRAAKNYLKGLLSIFLTVTALTSQASSPSNRHQITAANAHNSSASASGSPLALDFQALSELNRQAADTWNKLVQKHGDFQARKLVVSQQPPKELIDLGQNIYQFLQTAPANFTVALSRMNPETMLQLLGDDLHPLVIHLLSGLAVSSLGELITHTRPGFFSSDSHIEQVKLFFNFTYEPTSIHEGRLKKFGKHEAYLKKMSRVFLFSILLLAANNHSRHPLNFSDEDQDKQTENYLRGNFTDLEVEIAKLNGPAIDRRWLHCAMNELNQSVFSLEEFKGLNPGFGQALLLMGANIENFNRAVGHMTMTSGQFNDPQTGKGLDLEKIQKAVRTNISPYSYTDIFNSTQRMIGGQL